MHLTGNTQIIVNFCLRRSASVSLLLTSLHRTCTNDVSANISKETWMWKCKVILINKFFIWSAYNPNLLTLRTLHSYLFDKG